MDAAVIVEGPDAPDRLRSLREWLADVPELRGAVSLREEPPRPGTLGPVLDALVVALGPAGAVTAFATAVVAWLRTRRGEVCIKVTLTDGQSVELTATKVSGLDAAAVEQQVALVAGMLSGGRDGARCLEDS